MQKQNQTIKCLHFTQFQHLHDYHTGNPKSGFHPVREWLGPADGPRAAPRRQGWQLVQAESRLAL